MVYLLYLTQNDNTHFASTPPHLLRMIHGHYVPLVNPYPTAFPYGNGMVLHSYQQQESSMTKTVHKVINKRLKTYVYSLHTGENFH